jgi:hypothetical protein
MSDEAPEPSKPGFKTRWSRASRAEILLVATTSGLFLFTVFMTLRTLAGRPD